MARLSREGACSYLGRSRLTLERATTEDRRSGKSAEAVVAQRRAERPGHGEGPNRNDGEKRRLSLEDAMTPNRPSVPPVLGMVENDPWAAGPTRRRIPCRSRRGIVRNRRMRTRKSGGVAGDGRQITADRLYADWAKCHECEV